MDITRRQLFIGIGGAFLVGNGCSTKRQHGTSTFESNLPSALESLVLEGKGNESVFNPSISEDGHFLTCFEGKAQEVVREHSDEVKRMYASRGESLGSPSRDYIYPQTPLKVIDRVKNKVIASLQPPEGWNWLWRQTPTLTGNYVIAALFKGDPHAFTLNRKTYTAQVQEGGLAVFDFRTNTSEIISLGGRAIVGTLRSSKEKLITCYTAADHNTGSVYDLTRRSKLHTLPDFVEAEHNGGATGDISEDYIVFTGRVPITNCDKLDPRAGRTSSHIYLMDLKTGIVEQLTRNSHALAGLTYSQEQQPRISGRYVVYNDDTFLAHQPDDINQGEWVHVLRGMTISRTSLGQTIDQRNFVGYTQLPAGMAKINEYAQGKFFWDVDINRNGNVCGINSLGELIWNGDAKFKSSHHDLFTDLIAANERDVAVFGTKVRDEGQRDRSFVVYQNS